MLQRNKKKSVSQDLVIHDVEAEPLPWDISMFFRTGWWFNPSEQVVIIPTMVKESSLSKMKAVAEDKGQDLD